MPVYRFTLRIPAERILEYYKGTKHSIVVRSDEGKLIQFPAGAVRKYVDTQGVSGVFELECDSKNRLVEIRHVAPLSARTWY
ncbi:MAG: DUF2835 domain-containing protein [Verrucomicrobia bacterium]|nr:DUF2835 domain-containing protein [Verrucomicrobiota bacterium]MCF7709159.1 DUF2835 domain-containing protein [Verrucomicrobiota bacterium]